MEGTEADGRTPVTCTGTSPAYEPSVPDTHSIDLANAVGGSVGESLGGDQAILLNADSTISNEGDVIATV